MLDTKKIIYTMIALLGFAVLPINTSEAAINRRFGEPVGVKEVQVRGTQKKQNDTLIHVIQKGINRVLGILAFISLCLVLYAGFLMLTSGGDSKKYNEGFSIIKYAIVGLAIIAVSRLIVSLVFYVINGAMADNGITE